MGGQELQQIYQEMFKADVAVAMADYEEVFNGRSDSAYFHNFSCQPNRVHAFATLKKELQQKDLTIVKLVALMQVSEIHINIHKNPVADSVLSIKNTDHWKAALGLIRQKGVGLIQKQVVPLLLSACVKPVREACVWLEVYQQQGLFAAQKNNWFTSSETNAKKYIKRQRLSLKEREVKLQSRVSPS